MGQTFSKQLVETKHQTVNPLEILHLQAKDGATILLSVLAHSHFWMWATSPAARGICWWVWPLRPELFSDQTIFALGGISF